MAKIRCPRCGHKLGDHDKFCPECGAKVPPRVRRRHRFPWGCTLTTLVLLGALCVGGYYVYDFKAAKDREMEAYARLDGSENVEQYNDFIARFPRSSHVEEVRGRMERLREAQSAFALMLRRGDARELRRYLVDNPSTPRRADIEARLDTVEYYDAEREHTPEALDEYAQTHPHSPFLDASRSAARQLRRTTVSPEERSRLGRVAERFIHAMNNGDDGTLSYLMASRFESFNGRDTTLTSFNHDIMVYVNERFFHEDESLLLRLAGEPSIRKVPVGDDCEFDLAFSFTVGRFEDDAWMQVGPTHRLTGRVIRGGQFVRMDIE